MFNTSLQDTFVSYTMQHFLPVLVVFTIVGLIITNKEKLRNSKYFDVYRVSLAITILLQEVSLNLFRVYSGDWMVSTSLPFHLCGLAVITTSYLLLSKNQWVFNKVVFIMFIGATMALLTPSVEYGYGFPHYRYFQYFFSHGMIVVNLTFLLFVMDYQKDIKYRYLLDNFYSLIIIATVMFVVNLLTGGNYLYLMGKPGEGTAFDLFGEHPWYLINLTLFGVPIFFHLFYFPFYLRNVKRKRVLLKAT